VSTETQTVPAPVVEEAPTPLSSVARHWIITTFLVLVGTAAGLFYATTRPEVTTAEARLVVGSQDLKFYQVPGYAYAASQLAGTYAHFVGQPQSQSQLNKALGTRAKQIVSISGSPVPETGLVSVQVSATDRRTAVDAANLVASQLKTQANAPAPTTQTADALFANYNRVSTKIAQEQSAQDADRLALSRANSLASQASKAPGLRTAMVTRAAQISALELQQSTLKSQYTDAITNQPLASGLKDVEAGTVISNNHRSTLGRYGLGGLVGGFLVAVALAVALDRRRGRRPVRAGTPDR